MINTLKNKINVSIIDTNIYTKTMTEINTNKTAKLKKNLKQSIVQFLLINLYKNNDTNKYK